MAYWNQFLLMKNNMIQYFLFFLITMITVESKGVPDINTTSLEEAQEVAILGGGCFWCTEAVFEKIGGVTDVVSGYAGGKSKNPTYKEICTGKSGHAEVIRITFNSKVLSYTKILEIFGKCHDTTTLNRQGADVGTQYRSTIMYLNETQKSIAEKWKQDFNKRLSSPVVTEIVEAPTFYVAEEYHQDYYARNPNQGYCNFVIRPKLKKLNLE
jgi:peptide-methionine (S)-S-oxide reductase